MTNKYLKEKGTLIAFLSGSDWYDASVEHFVATKKIDFRREKKEWNRWYKNEYLPAYRKEESPPFFAFGKKWFQKRDLIRDATDKDEDEL